MESDAEQLNERSRDLAALIARSRALIAESQALRARSASLIEKQPLHSSSYLLKPLIDDDLGSA